MEKNKRNIQEPFKPEDTPTPPQNMHPGTPDGSEKQNDLKKPQPEERNEKKNAPDKKLLGESEIEIDDETTI